MDIDQFHENHIYSSGNGLLIREYENIKENVHNFNYAHFFLIWTMLYISFHHFLFFCGSECDFKGPRQGCGYNLYITQ